MSVWQVSPWLREAGLTYHAASERWLDGNRLRAVARGQEFIATIRTGDARAWVEDVIKVIAQ